VVEVDRVVGEEVKMVLEGEMKCHEVEFWNSVSVKRSCDVTRLQAQVDKKKIVISEAVIHEILQLNDAEGMVCLPNEEIFAGLAQMWVEGLENDKTAQQLEIVKLTARVKKLEKINMVKSSKLRRLKKVGTSQRVESSDDMDNRSKKNTKCVNVVNEELTAAKHKLMLLLMLLDIVSTVSSIKDDTEVQEAVEIVTTAKLMTEVVTAAATQVVAASTPILAAKSKIVIRKYVLFPNTHAGFQDTEKAGEEGTQTYVLFPMLSDEADINNLESIILVSPIPTTRIHKDHLTSQIIGDLSSTTQTRSMARAVRDQGGISQMFNEDFHTCMFACFLSQEEPKRVYQALKDLSWIKAMQEELLQFKMQKVWILVDLAYGKRAIVIPTLPPSPIVEPSSPPQQQQPSQPTNDAEIPLDLLHTLMETCTTLTRKVEALEQDKVSQALKIIKLKQRVKKLERKNKLKGEIIANMDADKDVTLKDVAVVAKEVEVEKDGEIEENADDDKLESSELKEVVEVVTTTKLMTEVVTAASATITGATTLITAATLIAAPSAAKKRKGVVIRDPKETATPSIIIHSEPKSKEEGK
nr:hypothetical protein [Tanacetum cinerariifolium]